MWPISSVDFYVTHIKCWFLCDPYQVLIFMWPISSVDFYATHIKCWFSCDPYQVLIFMWPISSVDFHVTHIKCGFLCDPYQVLPLREQWQLRSTHHFRNLQDWCFTCFASYTGHFLARILLLCRDATSVYTALLDRIIGRLCVWVLLFCGDEITVFTALAYWVIRHSCGGSYSSADMQSLYLKPSPTGL